MKGYRNCWQGDLIYQAQRLVSAMRGAGEHIHLARQLGTGDLQHVDRMIRLRRELLEVLERLGEALER